MIRASNIIAATVAVSLSLMMDAAAQTQRVAAPQISGAIDESVRVVARGNTRPEATRANDRGPVSDNLVMTHMLLQLRRPPALERAFERAIDDLTKPRSPTYHRWLTASRIGAEYGPAEADVQTVAGWLAFHGFRVNTIYPSRMVIDFSGTAGQVRDAFATEIHNLDVRGVHHIANMSDPSFPAALAPVIVGIVSLNDFRPYSMMQPRASLTVPGGPYLLAPADIATIYNLNPLFSEGITGNGQTVVVLEDTDLYSALDYYKFRSKFGLTVYTAGTLSIAHPAPATGANNCSDPGVNGDDGEATLDVEWASAAAPNAAIVLASCANSSTSGLIIAMQNLVNQPVPPTIVSMSYGICETEDGAAGNAAWYLVDAQAAAEGMSMFVSSGDQAAAVCDRGNAGAEYGITVNGFASTPYDVAVGGTDFGDTYAGTNSTYWNSANTSVYGSAKSYIPEIPWNDSCASQLLASANHFSTTYGSSGFCNSIAGESYLNVIGGSGGPSGCATGAPVQYPVVGGSCEGWGKPYWQKGFLGNPNDGVRDLPDVSLFAANGIWNHYYVFCFTDPGNDGLPCSGSPGTWSGAGGTSFASPIFAGMMALVAQKQAGANPKAFYLGNPNPVLYALAATEYGASGNSSCSSTRGNSVGSTCIFYDVTAGDMDVDCTGTVNCYLPSGSFGVLSTSNSSYQPAYGTTTGWDFATGIGTVNVYNLVNAWPTGG